MQNNTDYQNSSVSGQAPLKCLFFLSLLACFTAFQVLGLIPSSEKSAYAQSAIGETQNVQVIQGKAKVMIMPEGIADIVVANPGLLEVRALRSDQISLVGINIGNTNVLVLDEQGNVLKTLNVHVSIDEDNLRAALKRFFPNEKNIDVRTVGDDVVLSGSVRSAETATAIRDLVTRFAAQNEQIVNMLSVESEQQVMIKVKVLEVSRTILNELGIETDLTQTTANGELVGAFGTTGSLGLSVDPSFGIGSLTYTNGGFGPLSVLFRALERDGMINTLAEPNLTAVSGENARFLAGGEFPIPTSRDRDGNIVYEYRPFGVSLAFRPVVLSSGRINMQVQTEVSEVSTEQVLQLPGITVPSFTVRRADTTVELGNGGSLMMAGLIESQAIRSMNELPGVNKFPILGDLVSSESFRRNESELLIVVTAYLVKPFEDKETFEKTHDRKVTQDALKNRLHAHLSEIYGLPNTQKMDGVNYILD